MIFRQQVLSDFLGSDEGAFDVGQFHGIDYNRHVKGIRLLALWRLRLGQFVDDLLEVVKI
jgi:hypothetical protein